MAWVHNFHGSDPNNEIVTLIVINLVFPILALLAVCLRFYVRRRTKRAPWVDDYAVLVGAILTMARSSLVIAQTRWGLGLSRPELLPSENIVMFIKLSYSSGPLYTLALLAFKVSLLTWYLRIGSVVPIYRNITIFAIITVTINQLIMTFLVLLTCIPVAKIWHPSIPGHCINGLAFYYAIAATSIAFDIIIIILPVPVLWRLTLRMQQKIALTMIFAVGFLVTVIQIIRIMTVDNLRVYTNSKTTSLWSTIEISLGVILACILTYGPLFKAFASTVTSRCKRGPTTPSRTLISPRREKLTRMPPSSSSYNSVHGSDTTRNTTIVTARHDEHRLELGNECQEHSIVGANPWHIHTTLEVSVNEGSS